MTVRNRILVAFGLGLGVGAVVVGTLLATGLIVPNVSPGPRLGIFVGVCAVMISAVWFSIRLLVRGDGGTGRATEHDGERDERPTSPGQLAGPELREQLTSLTGHVREVAAGGEDAFSAVEEGSRRQAQSASRTYDALGQLREDLVDASAAMEDLAVRVVESSTSVSEMDRTIGRAAEMVGGLRTSIEQAAATVRQGDQSARRLSDDLEDLSVSVAAAADALSDVTIGAEQVRNDSRHVAGNMAQLQAQAARIGEAVEGVIHGSDSALSSNERILTVTSNLESRLGAIDDVIEVIRNLAERTKLLSINASIIASEAGEHGRAFAVVASEVKDLASSTTGAIGEISTALGAIKEGFQETVETIQIGQVDVQQGVKVARDAVEVLRAIPEQVHETARLSEEITSRTERQVLRGHEVGQAIDRMVTALDQVGELLAEQIASNQRTLELYRAIDDSAGQVVRSAEEHALAAKGVSQGVEHLSGDFRSLAERVKRHLEHLGVVVEMSEDILRVTDSNRRKAESLSSVLFEIGRCGREIERFIQD